MIKQEYIIQEYVTFIANGELRLNQIFLKMYTINVDTHVMYIQFTSLYTKQYFAVQFLTRLGIANNTVSI